jgi:hypothetical protein
VLLKSEYQFSDEIAQNKGLRGPVPIQSLPIKALAVEDRALPARRRRDIVLTNLWLSDAGMAPETLEIP